MSSFGNSLQVAAVDHDLHDQALAAEAREQRELGRAADCVEGVGAFLAKRAAVFRDR